MREDVYNREEGIEDGDGKGGEMEGDGKGCVEGDVKILSLFIGKQYQSGRWSV